MRWPSSLILPGLLLGCAFDAGQPWGLADASLEVAFEPPASRLDDEGRIKTSNSYRVRLDRLALRVDAITLQMASGAGEALSFDPADPPEGYSLCHGGHCHHDSGALVDYEAIELELRGAGGGASLVLPVTAGEVELEAGGRAALALAPCEGRSCDLPRGSLGGLVVGVAAVELSLHVSDTRPPDERRLPGGGAAFELSVGEGLQPAIPLAARIDDEHPVGVRIEATLQVPESLFDGVDWPASGAAAAGGITSNLSEEITIDASVQRFVP